MLEGVVRVDAWQIDLDADVPAAAVDTLSGDERVRARAFRFPHLEGRFIAAHAALRAILAGYAGRDPSALVFSQGPQGKPALAGHAGLGFNLSHSHQAALCAVVLERSVGVDLEWLRDDRHPFDRLDRYFSPAECASLSVLPPHTRRTACYTCWTRKEAFMKARGDGLSLPLGSFDVTCVPGEPPDVLAVRGPAADGRSWTVFDVSPPGYAGAIVVEGRDLQLRHRRFTWRG